MPIYTGAAGNDVFNGDGQEDTASGGGGDDTLNGGGGRDALAGDAGADILNGGDGDDRLYSAGLLEMLYGSIRPQDGWPLVDTGSEVDTLIGGAGSDEFYAGYGDNVDGGAESYSGDSLFISFMGASAGVSFDFSLATQVIGGGTITGIENISYVQGSDFADTLNLYGRGNGYSDFTTVRGMGGADTINAGYYTGYVFGDDGDDILDARYSQYLSEVDGGEGNDVILVSDGTYTVRGGAGDDSMQGAGTMFGGSGDDEILAQYGYYSQGYFGEAGDDVIRAESHSNYFFVGGDGADTLTGNESADTLNSAGSGAQEDDLGVEVDVLDGMAGNDIIAIGYGDTALGGDGTDTLRLSLAGATAGVTLNINTLTGGGSLSLGGGTISGFERISRLRGSEFGDTFTLTNQFIGLTVDAGGGADVIIATTSAVTVNGGAGDDRFITGTGHDTFNGGDGNDTVDLGAATAALVVNLASASIADGRGGTDTLVSVESITAGAFNDTLVGDAAANRLNGAGGDDLLTGRGGIDVLTGGAGVDTASYAAAAAGVVVNLALGSASSDGDGATDTLIGVENLVGSAFNDVLTGDAAANLLSGGAGDDTLRGGAGADTLDGGAGLDTADYGDAAGTVTGSLAAGVVNADGAVDALSGIENLTGGAAADVLGGDAGANRLDGGAGNDRLAGLAGADALIGGDGVDLADYAASVGGVSLDLSIGTAADGFGTTDTLGGVENVTGSAFADALFGDAAANALSGGDGDDVLRGRGGADVLTGGAGIDTADYSTAAAGMRAQLNANAASNDGDGGADTFSGIENLTGSAFNDTLVGDGAANVLRGGLGSDVLLGLAGNDVLWGGAGTSNTLQGGQGDDRYVLEAVDSVVEAAGEGNDTIEARINAYVVAANIEAVVFTGTGNFAGTGNAGANTITGGAGDDNLRGRGGVDVLNGGGGVDTVDFTLAAAGVTARLDVNRATNDGDGATDTFTGVENLTGSVFNDLLIGDGSANVLKGGIGTDTLLGFGGDDVLWGGSGGGNNQLQGGTGNDYYVLEAFDTVVELAGEGVDTVEARIGSYVMGANIENLLFVGGSGTFVGTGNAMDNHITGGTGNDILRGRGGNDVIGGGLGRDEVQLRGLANDYDISAEGAGWRIVDGVAGRDGSTFVTSIEVLRFANNVTRALTYATAAPTADGKDAGPETSPFADDVFVAPLSIDGQPFDPADLSGLDLPTAGRMFAGLHEHRFDSGWLAGHADTGLSGYGPLHYDDWLF